MRLNLTNRMSNKARIRLKKKVRLRKKLYGTSERPRLSVFRSARHVYAQLIDDTVGKTLVEASSLTSEIEGGKGSRVAAKAIGIEIAKRAQSKNIKAVVFDRNGFQYHGRIQAIADGAREGGLIF